MARSQRGHLESSPPNLDKSNMEASLNLGLAVLTFTNWSSAKCGTRHTLSEPIIFKDSRVLLFADKSCFA